MSRIGKLPIEIPAGVEVKIEGHTVTAKGPLGTETVTLRPELSVAQEGNTVVVTRNNDDRKSRSLHGLSRTLVANAIHGVKTGFEKNLEIVGIGYRAAMKGNTLSLHIGYSHEVDIEIEDGVKVECPTATTIKVSGISKERVGQVAANIREVRKPEPYKGKGIKYVDEVIIRKEGKTAGKK